jgi:hypothetical protein
MEVNGHLYAPATLPPGYEPPEPIGWEGGWVPEPDLDAVARTKLPSSCEYME